MAKKTAVKKQEVRPEETPKSKTSFFDYLRFGESYTSLILGIIVVIISTALLLSFVHNRNVGTNNNPLSESQKDIAQASQTPTQASSSATPSPTITKAPTATPVPTVKKEPTVKPTTKSTVKPTVAEKKVAKATIVPTKAQPTSKPQVDNKAAKTVDGGEYVVKKGDTLWNIAERHYHNGYKWVDIARVNKLSSPSNIFAGNKLTLPKLAVEKASKAEPKKAQVNNEQKNTASPNKITADTYKIMKGDTLWSIAVRAYGDGYKWVDIARANKLDHPGLIHVNNTLKLPRGK